MNIRAALHTIAVVATAIAGGTLVIAGFDGEAQQIIVSASSVVALVINTYMGFTTTGAAKP